MSSTLDDLEWNNSVLKIHPFVLGDGRRLFGETSHKKPLRLLRSKTIDGDVVYRTDEIVRLAA